MSTTFTIADFKKLDTAAKDSLLAEIADLKAIGANADVTTVEGEMTSVLAPMPATTYAEIKARLTWMAGKKATLKAAGKVLRTDAHLANVEQMTKDLKTVGVKIGAALLAE